MILSISRRSDQTTTFWSGGTTTQLAIYPENANYKEKNFLFRISTAKVDSEQSVFTNLPGVARIIMILDGILKIEHPGRYSKTLKKFETDSFLGDWETISYGSAVDFNLMTTGNVHGKLYGKSMKRNESIKLSTFSLPVIVGLYAFKGDLLFNFNTDIINLTEGDFILIHSDKALRPIEIKAIDDAELAIAEIQLQPEKR